LELNSNTIIYDNVRIGKDPVIEEFVILGKPPRNKQPGELPLIIGDSPVIRTGTIVYAGNVIGHNFQSGDYARLREDNKIGNNVSVGGGSVIEGKCVIGDNVRIHSNCFIAEYADIKDNVWIGPGVIMTNVLHPPCPEFKTRAPLHGKKCCCGPIIENSAVIGAGAIMLPGVVIGKNALVGAGAVVAKDVPDGHVLSGFAARSINRIEELICPLNVYAKGDVYKWRRK
jgi:acetyltransferase-like isoleucine patch superfamily enzyme